ncbi:type IV pilus biogenesis protein PilM [Rossellomorea aquimaris]|uniref:Type IV pilus assembly protein PilM n=1 Tax=Rossellomorea aquimaris TaxID=189382 RepID=A0A366ES10_9BACI|nr:pilus assembly protein PilM [Rossellomorea aquimaris]RBP04289.1 type IV pilus assembly protein PilM [Rossellomorea aquimaris]
MLSRLFNKNKNKINIVISDQWIRFVELKSISPLHIHHFGEKRIADGMISDGKIIEKEAFQVFLEECVLDWGIKKREVQFIVPNTQMIIRKMEISSDIEDDEVKSHLFLEIGTSIHLPFENPVFDVVVVGNKGDKKEIILVAAPEDIVMEYQQILTDAHLKPVVADISPLAFYRYVHSLDLTHREDHEMLLYFNQANVTVSIFHDHQPVFFRPIGLGEDREVVDDRGYQKDFHSLQFDEVMKEIDKVISFYRYTLTNDEAMINKIYVTGDHPMVGEIHTLLSNRFEIDILQVPTAARDAYTNEELSSAFLLAIGLGLKEVI